MKNILFRLFLLSGLVLFTRCEDPDNAIYTVLEDYTNGAVLRTKSDPRNSFQFNRSEPDQAFFVKIEQQDEENGDLLERVDVYVTLNGSSYAEARAASFERSAFTQNDNGLNEIEISLTLTQAIAAIGAASSDYSGGDSITVRLELVLTDGRTFSSGDATGSLQGSYFSSPYAYNAVIKCIPASPKPGTYNIAMQDSYGDGWNGGFINVVINGTALAPITIASGSSGTGSFVVPAGATSLEVNYSSGSWDSEVTFQITRNGESIYSDGPSPSTDVMVFSICNP
ncbi:MAG: hypothetical protein ACPG7X_02015 [Flavobacteriaceae bacterium]